MIEPPDRHCAPLWGARRVAPERPRPRPMRLAWLLWALTIAAAIGTAVYAARAAAEPVELDCTALAIGIAIVVDFRDTDADLEKTVALTRARNADATPATLAVIEREIRRAWREQLSRDAASFGVYQRCRAQLGDMGRDG